MFRKFLTAFTLLAALVLPALGQGVGQLDIAGGATDYGSSNLHYTIPVFSKPGFSFNIDINSHAYVGLKPNGAHGEQFYSGTLAGANAGFEWQIIPTQSVTVSNGCSSQSQTTYSAAVLQEPSGASHPLPANFQWKVGAAGGSCNVYPPSGDVTTDNSGITVVVPQTLGATWLAYDKHGNSYVLNTLDGQPFAAQVYPKFTDTYGNTVSVVSSGGNVYYVDSTTTTSSNLLGHAGAVVKISGGPAPSPINFSYVDGSGTVQTVTLNYFTGGTVSTHWGCTSIAESTGIPGQYFPSSVSLPDGTSWTFGYEIDPGGNGSNITGRLYTVLNPQNSVVEYAYSGGTSTYGMDCSRYVVPTLKVSPTGLGPWTYTNAAITQTPAAWAQVTETNAVDNGKTITIYEGSDPNIAINSEPQVFIGNVQVLQGSTSLSNTQICYNGSCSTEPAYPLTEVDTYAQINASPANRTAKFFDGFGNTLKTQRYDFGGTTLLQQEFASYGKSFNSGTSCNGYGSGSYVNDTPCYVYSENPSNAIVAQTKYSYNPQGSMLTSSSYTGSQWLTNTLTYNSNGTINTSKNPSGLTTTFGYSSSECNSLIPVSVINSFNSLTASVTYDSGCYGGRVVQSENVGGSTDISSTAYADYFWRPTSHTDPNGNTVSVTYKDATPAYVSTTMQFNSSITLYKTTMFDSFGNKTLDQVYTGNGVNWDSASYSLDGLGRLQTITSPFEAPEFQFNCLGTCPANETYTYDALGRVLTATDVNGKVVTNTYQGKDTLTAITPAPTGENPKQVRTEINGIGQLMSSCALTSAGTSCGQAQSGTGWATVNAYDALGNLLSETNGTQVHTFTYDQVGRVLTATYPESGTTTNAYDTISGVSGCASFAGALVQSKNNDGSFACPQYDGLGRVILKTYGGNANTALSAYLYDGGSTNDTRNGRLNTAWTCPGGSGIYTCPFTNMYNELAYLYDNNGNVLTQTEVTGGNTYVTNETFDSLDRIQTLSWTNGSNFNFGAQVTAWDGEARPATVVSGSTPLVSTAVYGVFGPTSVSYGNGNSSVIAYDNLGHITSQRFNLSGSCGGGSCYDQKQITWNANGTVQSLYDLNNLGGGILSSNTLTNLYDDLSRIYQSSSTDGVLSQQFTYDRWDNITAVSNVGNTSGPAPNMYNAGTNRNGNNQLNPGTGCPGTPGPCYDTNGRMTIDERNFPYSWDVEGRMVGNNGNGVSYDALGNRALIGGCSGGCAVLTIPGFDRTTTPASSYNDQEFNLPLPGADVVYSSSTGGFVNYVFKDHLGNSTLSSNVGTTNNGVANFFTEFSPFGQQFDRVQFSGFPYAIGFNGFNGTSNALDGSGEDWLTPARASDGIAGRWFSPDPAHSGWNAYTFAGNNPTSVMDPSGLQPAGCIVQCNEINSANGEGLNGLPSGHGGHIPSTPGGVTTGADYQPDPVVQHGPTLNIDGSVNSGPAGGAGGSWAEDQQATGSIQSTVGVGKYMQLPVGWNDTPNGAHAVLHRIIGAFDSPMICGSGLCGIAAGVEAGGIPEGWGVRGIDPFAKPCPKCGHVFVEEMEGIVDGIVEHTSDRVKGGVFEQYGDQAIQGGYSAYFRRAEGITPSTPFGTHAYRASDHTFFGLPEGLSPERAVNEFGGKQFKPETDPDFWIFTKKPVITIYPF